MPLYNFQKRFAPFVESGEKTHTIRGKRKHPAKAGDRLYLYTGLRQKGSRKLLEAICTRVEDITIGRDGVIVIDGNSLSKSEANQLALRDGFSGIDDMLNFWDGRLPFVGDVIHWRAA